MKIKKILCEPLLYLLPLLAALYLVVIPAKMEISDANITRNNNTQYIKIKLPYSVDMAEGEMFSISFNLSVKDKKTAKFTIMPDDCIQEVLINGENFPLNGIKGLCDYHNGVYFDFSKYVQEGFNHFEFRMTNIGGPGGLRIETPYNGFKGASLKHFIFVFVFVLSTFLILRKFKFKFRVILIILLGMAVRLIVYTYTGPMQNPYDVLGHLEYIQIIAEEKRVPKVNEGWSTYHPPLYYVVSAAIKIVADSYDPNLTNRVLQQESLLISFASVVLVVALIVNLFGNCWVAYLASLVAVLWPGFVLTAPRISNESSLFYFGALFCMLFAQRYWRLHKNSDIFLASLGASIALAGKSTGFIILGVWVIVYILSALRFLRIGSLKTLLASAFIVVLFAGFSNYRSIVDAFEGKKFELVGNASGLNGNLRVNSMAGNFLYFDMRDYLLNPYTSPWTDEGGRQYYWNYALKTSLFGELRPLNFPIGYTMATFLSIFALIIFVLALWGIIHAKFKDFPPLLFMVFLFAAHIYLRITIPYSCSNDFRCIFPALFPVIYFAIHGMQLLENQRIKELSYISMLAFVGLSFAFIVAPAI